jgi:peptide deformylase
MIETAKKLDAFGLAAPQVGVLKRVFVARRDKLSDEFEVYINPVIILKKEKVTHHGEACLSLPGSWFDVGRFKSITLDSQDRNGQPRLTKSKTKMQAFCFQHEMDHLDGVLLNEKGYEK